MIILHHLGVSQSERILWLLEELQIPYELVLHTRAPLLSPDSLKNIPGNETGQAPFVEDTEAGIKLSESGAICEYIIHKYGNGRLSVQPSDPNYVEYVRWLHFANGTLQPAFMISMFSGATGAAPDNPIIQIADARLHTALATINKRLESSKWLAGDFSVADVMTLYIPSTQRYWGPQVDLGKYGGLVRWMKDCGDRPAYQRAMQKGEPQMKTLLGAEPPSVGMVQVGGVTSDHWKK